MAKGADLDIDDDLKDDIEQKLGGSKRAKYAENDTMRQKYEKKDAKDRKKSEDTATGDEEKEMGLVPMRCMQNDRAHHGRVQPEAGNGKRKTQRLGGLSR